MKLLLFTFILLPIVAVYSQPRSVSLRDELIRMRDRDQAVRDACTTGNADEIGKCIIKSADEVDRPNTRRLNEIFAAHGFPTVPLVGSEGVKAFILLMQHSGDVPLRKKSEPGMKKAFRAKVISPSEYATFVDRLLVDQGKLQIYGSNFEAKEGKLVMSPTVEVANIDKRRKKIGLPPIVEYIRMLREHYKVEVVTPNKPN
jgi:hypothetical protein